MIITSVAWAAGSARKRIARALQPARRRRALGRRQKSQADTAAVAAQIPKLRVDGRVEKGIAKRFMFTRLVRKMLVFWK
jgi:hypothetical protein